MEEALSIFAGGSNRIVLPSLALLSLVVAPPTLLALLLSIPIDKLPSVIKQIVSIPLIAAVFLIPFGFTNGNRVTDLAVGVTNYNVFLRFFELYWIGPMVQDRPVYATIEALWVECWGCLRTFPKPAKEDTKELKKGETKVYVKDKKFYHILCYLATHMIITDVFGTWAGSFTGHEAVLMSIEKPVMYFIFIVAGNLLLNGAFNTVGYSLHLFYCLAFEGGSYSSEQWRPLMIQPLFSRSLDDLWSHRWHGLFKATWIAFPFRPVRILTTRALAKRVRDPRPIVFLLSSLSVFAASALMHEYVIAANMGLSIYNREFRGEQCVFFIGHGCGVIIEHLFKMIVAPKLSTSFKRSPLCRLLQHVWVVSFVYFTYYYIMHGFLSWGFQFDNPLKYIKPHILEMVATRPALQAYFGSHV